MRFVRILIAAASTLSCILFAAAWVRGYYQSDVFGYVLAGPGGRVTVPMLMHGLGGVGLGVVEMPPAPGMPRAFWETEPPGYAGDLGRDPTAWKAGGFLFARVATPRESGWAVAAPAWFLMLVSGAWPAWRLRRRRRERARRRRLGLCPLCAYDLRATPGRCPEVWTREIMSPGEYQ